MLPLLLALALPIVQDAPDARPRDVAEAVAWLEGESRRLIRASKRAMADGTAAFPPQVGTGYEAFWVRDYAYTLEGSIDAYGDQELLDACRLFVRSLRADGAGVDCVRFDGTPLYMPGYGTMGENPVADGAQFTVDVAWHTWRRTHDAGLLAEVLDPLVRALRSVPRAEASGLVWIDPGKPWDRCPYGFTDSVRKQGELLFSSLLLVESSDRLADLLEAGGRAEEAAEWRADAARVAASVRTRLWDPEAGLFLAASARCRQPDVWGSAFAVHLGVADDAQAATIAATLRARYDGLVQRGQVRHLLPATWWEEACPRETYQNGGFWATPTGWVVEALDRVDPALADRTVLDLVEDFRTGGACEWILGETRTLPGYLASAALPLQGVRAMLARRRARGATPEVEHGSSR